MATVKKTRSAKPKGNVRKMAAPAESCAQNGNKRLITIVAKGIVCVALWRKASLQVSVCRPMYMCINRVLYCI